MAAKMTADPDTRIITITEAPVGGFQALDVVDDIYEPMKDDWFATPSLQKLRFPFRSIGDPKSATSQIGPYAYFDNVAGWRFLPFDGDHRLELLGNLVGESAVAGVSLPIFLSRPGRTIIIPFETSAQALTNTVATGDGLSVAQDARLERIEKFLRNKLFIDPITGKALQYNDAGAAVEYEAPAYSDDGVTPYDGTQPIARRDRLEPP